MVPSRGVGEPHGGPRRFCARFFDHVLGLTSTKSCRPPGLGPARCEREFTLGTALCPLVRESFKRSATFFANQPGETWSVRGLVALRRASQGAEASSVCF